MLICPKNYINRASRGYPTSTLKWLAHGPREEATSFSGYIINNIRFNTKDCKNSRQNSGVLIEVETMYRSSVSDMR